MVTCYVDSIFKAHADSYDVIEIDNYFILNILQNILFREYSNFVYQFGLKTCRTKFRQNSYDQCYFDNKISQSSLEYCKNFTFYQKMTDFK